MSHEKKIDEKPLLRSDDEESRQAQQGRQRGNTSEEGVGHTPGKAEGDEKDVDEAFRNQK